MANVFIDYNNTANHDINPVRDTGTAISVENVNAFYGNTQALHQVNMNIKKNSITAFIGPSGCGKTTLLKCINRMNDIVKNFRLEGNIRLHGEDLYDRSRDVMSIRQKIGMVFQQPNPFPMTIFDNIRLPIVENIQGIGRSKVREIIIQKLKDASLYDEVKSRLNQSALRLSGGQQQRLCIARALSIEPEILLFDEPCSALDHISTMKIENLLLELKEKFTIVIVTHNLQQATRIADYAAFFYQGRIEEQGLAQDVFLNPQSQLTANYLHGAF